MMQYEVESPSIAAEYSLHEHEASTLDPIALAQLEGHELSQLQDGTVEVTHRLPKKEYYMSLRRFTGSNVTGGGGGTTHRLGSISSGNGSLGMAAAGSHTNGNGGTHSPSHVGLLPSGSTMSRTATTKSANNTLRGGHVSNASLNFKPSGKTVDCTVVMLDGTTREFRLDKAAYGQQLFDSVCAHLGLLEFEYFGITYYDSTNIWFWLHLDQKISKQIGKGDWQFEFQVKFYPNDIDLIKEDLTRYYLCLQVRQDLVSGQLPCSFMTYCLLGAYIVQSEAGDHDPVQHLGIKYIQDHPFAPRTLQTPEMLERIVQLHKLHRGQTPEDADRIFLYNASCLALYGVDFHKAKTSHDEDCNIGIYHQGILLYRNRIRLMCIVWARIITLSHKGRNFHLSLRRCENDTTQRKSMSFKCINATFAKRLYDACVDHHSFFRLRGGSHRPKKTSFLPSFATRKYHFTPPTLRQHNGNGISGRPVSQFRPIPSHADASWFTLRPDGNPHFDGAIASQYQYQPAMLAKEDVGIESLLMESTPPVGSALHQQQLTADLVPLNGSGAPGGVHRHLGAHGATNTTAVRPNFAGETWRISPADRTPGLGIDSRGLDVAAQRGGGWQGCRSNKGIKGPGAYYYEAACLEDGSIRVGWSTNDASLELGSDNFGFGYGSDANGANGVKDSSQGRSLHRNSGHDYGVTVKQGDVIGCLLDLDKGCVAWSCNGHVFSRAFTLPDQLRGESFFPAASIKDSRILFNFGDQPLEHFPGGPFTPTALAADDQQVSNRNAGWRMNPYDASQALDVAPEGSGVQSHFNYHWEGCRANQGIRVPGRYYFEATPLEDSGLCRVGWSTEEASLNLGSDRFGFGYGADLDGFGLNGQQGKRMHNDEIENYGEAFGKGDVIGCYLDTIDNTVKWSKNGQDFGTAYRIPPELSVKISTIPSVATHATTHSTTPVFYPTLALLNCSMEVNFGDNPFQFYPGPDWMPICCAPPEAVKLSRRKGPERKVKGWSYIDPLLLEPALRDIHLAHSPRSTAECSPNNVAASPFLVANGTPVLVLPTKPPPTGGVPMPGMIPLASSSVTSTPVHRNGVARSSSPQSPSATSNRNSFADNCNKNASSSLTRHIVNGGVVSVERSEPQIETEQFYDENGKLIRRTVRKSEVTTTKTISERIIRGVDGCGDTDLERVLLEVTQLDADHSVLNSDPVDLRSRAHDAVV